MTRRHLQFGLPVAYAGADITDVSVGQSVVLDGSASLNPGDGSLQYEWTVASRPPGSTAELNDADQVAPSLLIDVDGTYELTLTVTNSAGESVADTVQITTDTVPTFATFSVLVLNRQTVAPPAR